VNRWIEEFGFAFLARIRLKGRQKAEEIGRERRSCLQRWGAFKRFLGAAYTARVLLVDWAACKREK